MKQSTLDGLDRYVRDRIPTGDFLYSVLTNNLRESFAFADEENMRDLKEIVEYCYRKIPGVCWGSPEMVRLWLEGRQKDEISKKEISLKISQ